MKTDVLLSRSWFTYVNVHEPVGDWRRVSFGGMDYSPNNSPERYYIDEPINGIELIFEAEFPDLEWTPHQLNLLVNMPQVIQVVMIY